MRIKMGHIKQSIQNVSGKYEKKKGGKAEYWDTENEQKYGLKPTIGIPIVKIKCTQYYKKKEDMQIAL